MENPLILETIVGWRGDTHSSATPPAPPIIILLHFLMNGGTLDEREVHASVAFECCSFNG